MEVIIIICLSLDRFSLKGQTHGLESIPEVTSNHHDLKLSWRLVMVIQFLIDVCVSFSL